MMNLFIVCYRQPERQSIRIWMDAYKQLVLNHDNLVTCVGFWLMYREITA